MAAPRQPTRYWLGKKRSPETIEKIRQAKLGKTPWNKGKTGIHSEDARKRMSEAHKRMLGPKSSNWKGGLPHCPDCGKKIWYTNKRCMPCSVRARSGSKAYQWKGGVKPLVLRIRHNPKSHDWRDAIFKRDNYTCQNCGKRGSTILHADHYPKSFAEIFHSNKIKTLEQALACAEFWDLNNGRTLCVTCHRKTPSYGYKGRSFSPPPI